MPSDDREKLFETALAHHLRADASAAACADAETLAAYHQRSLPVDEMASLKTHVHSCERCRQILDLLGEAQEIPVAATAAPPLPAKSNLLVVPARRAPSWRWLVPAGAIAAALLVWIAVRENQPLRPPAPQPVLTAKQLEPAPAPPPPQPPAFNSASKASAPPADSSNALPVAPAPSARLQNSLAQPLASQSDSAAKKRSYDALAQRARVPQISEAPAAKTDLRAQAENKTDDLSRDALFPPAPQPAPAAAASGPQPIPARLDAGAPSESFSAASRALPRQDVSGLSFAKDKAELRLANVVSEVTVSAPGGLVSWRVGHAGVIEFSPDAGKSWTVQPSGVIVDLLAGSATSDQVCWLVGRAGTILRTTDAGLHWQKLRSPTQEDLRSVFAADARHATVSPAGATYQTADGGATWQKLSPE